MGWCISNMRKATRNVRLVPNIYYNYSEAGHLMQIAIIWGMEIWNITKYNITITKWLYAVSLVLSTRPYRPLAKVRTSILVILGKCVSRHNPVGRPTCNLHTIAIDLIVDSKISTEDASSQSMMVSKREQNNNPPDNFRCCFRRHARRYCSLFDPITHCGFYLR